MAKWLLGVCLFAMLCVLAWVPLWLARPPVCPPAAGNSPPALPAVPPPDLQRLAAMVGGGMQPLTEEQMAEERQMQDDQVAAAREWLMDTDEQERLAGAEQLSAYPTPEAESALRDSLQFDGSLAVRVAAVESLSRFKSLRPETVKALLAALRDGDEQMSFGALSTLQSLVYRADVDEATHGLVMRGLKSAAKDNSLSMNMREEINDLLLDQPD